MQSNVLNKNLNTAITIFLCLGKSLEFLKLAHGTIVSQLTLSRIRFPTVNQGGIKCGKRGWGFLDIYIFICDA